jgi:hypothetical protein
MAPLSGQSGTAVVTVTATDAYGQSTQNSVTLTIDAPPAPASEGGGGGSVDLTLLAVLSAMGIIRLQSARIRPCRERVPAWLQGEARDQARG